MVLTSVHEAGGMGQCEHPSNQQHSFKQAPSKATDRFVTISTIPCYTASALLRFSSPRMVVHIAT